MFKTMFKRKQSASDDINLANEDFFSELRAREFSRLDAGNHVYLDYTGGGLYASSQLDAHQRLLRENVFGNPHSTNPTSVLATQLCEEARTKVSSFFNAEDYYCIFTQNASSALKIIGECYPFGDKSHFLLFADNHNSVNGIREYSIRHNGSYDYVPLQYEDLCVDDSVLNQMLGAHSNKTNKLLAYPAQSNVSGVKHDLNWIAKAQDNGWDVLLDAAAFVPTNRLDLKVVQPDFVTVSFYKIFGYPTGVGCLLVRKDKFDKLEKQWFAGGTVTLASVLSANHFLAENHERFENGTLSYLDIPAVTTGLNFIEHIGIERITERVGSLARYTCEQLRTLKHSNGNPQVHIFGPENRANTGGTIIMNFFNPDAQRISFERIEERTNERMISIRSGCFCNPGIDEINNKLSTGELDGYFTQREHGTYSDMVAHLNKMRGATRLSIGVPTIKEDIDAFVDFVRSLTDVTV